VAAALTAALTSATAALAAAALAAPSLMRKRGTPGPGAEGET
jgi:hypothetical protein